VDRNTFFKLLDGMEGFPTLRIKRWPRYGLQAIRYEVIITAKRFGPGSACPKRQCAGGETCRLSLHNGRPWPADSLSGRTGNAMEQLTVLLQRQSPWYDV